MKDNLIDRELLQRLSEHFCNANDIYLACLDREYQMVCSCNCGEAEQAFWKERIDSEVMKRLIADVEISHVETIVEESLPEEYLKLCGVITRARKKIELIWVAAAVIEEKLTEDAALPEGISTVTEERFYRGLSFLEVLSKQVLNAKEKELEAKAAMEQMKVSEAVMKEQLHRSDAMASVVQMLENEESFASLADRAIREICNVLDIQGGCLLRKSADGATIEVLCEYAYDKNWAIGGKLQGSPSRNVSFFDGKPYMISYDSMMPEIIEKFFKQYHLQAAVFQPVDVNERDRMYLCLYEFDKERIWDVEDVKFISDVKRVIQSILARRIAQNSLAGSYASLEAILENVGCGIYVVDYDRREILYINERLKQLSVVREDVDKMKTLFFHEANRERVFGPKESYVKEDDKWLMVNQTEIDWVEGRRVCLGTVFDITDQRKHQEKLEKQVSTDSLTGLFNRRRCLKDLEEYIREAELYGKEGAYLQMDLDDFKNINDGLGYQYGDVLLKAISHNLERISGIENNCYRTGGDEFVVIVHGDAYKELSRICREIRLIFDKPWFLKGEDYFCTMSMGVVCFPTDGNTVEDLTKKADMALLTAKKKSKNCVEFYNEKVEDTSFYRLDLEKNMRRATLNACNEFEVYYQPIMDQDKQGNPCCGAEALVRWNSTELGFISPTDFIPLAEYLGLINPIGEHVLYEAVKRCKYWNDCGHPDYKVNVNLSVIQLLQNDFVKKVKNVLEKTNINPKNVTLEVTESLAINDMERTRKILEQIKELGVKVALDDFGTGFSSLNHIRKMPIDVIKIDKCFVDNLVDDEFSGAFVKMVSELAKTIGVTVCVEGVEQKKQLEVLKDMNVKLIQGYYYGKPMPVQDFEKMYL